jgi:hypothetical protein
VVVRSLLARIAIKKAIGLYVGEQQITACQVASTPLGPVQIACHSERYEPDQLSDTIVRLLKPMLGGRKRGPQVAIGLPAPRVFFSTRPIRTTHSDASAQALLHEVLQSPNICIDDMLVEVIKADSGKRKLASIVSCRKKYMTGLLETLEGCGVRPFRAEPAPCALLRAAAEHRRTPRRSKIALRIFLGDRQGLAVVTAGALTVLWRFFNWASEGEAAAICSAVRSVGALIGHCGIDSPLDVVMIHGRSDLRAGVESEEFRRQVAVPIMWSGGPELNDAAVAFGLALGCLGQQPLDAFDLSRSLKPRVSIWDIFPWVEVAVQIAMVVCMGLFLWMRSQSIEKALEPVKAQYAKRAWLSSMPQAEIQKERQDLEQRVEAIRKFVATRIIWTAYTHDISSRLPADATMTMFQGLCELETSGKNVIKPKKAFTIRASAPIAQDGSTPKEIDRFLTALRGNALLKRDFPIVDLADIKWYQPNITAPANALFTVICLPKSTNAPPKPAEDKDASKAKGK